MTNSEKQSKPAEASASLPAYANADFWGMAITKRPALFFGGLLLLIGWGFSLHINNWHFTVPVLMLWFGWLGVLFTVRLLWSAAVAVAAEAGADSAQVLDVSESRRIELLEEKKSLIRAIKEIEFDRDLGKMSDDDATEIMRFYRARAIEVIKELDGNADGELTVAQRVERDLQARLAVQVATSAANGKRRAKADGAAAADQETPAANPKDSDPEEGPEAAAAKATDTDGTDTDTPPSAESKDSDAPTKKLAASASEEPAEAPLESA